MVTGQAHRLPQRVTLSAEAEAEAEGRKGIDYELNMYLIQ
jgi:hypothetical protein